MRQWRSSLVLRSSSTAVRSASSAAWRSSAAWGAATGRAAAPGWAGTVRCGKAARGRLLLRGRRTSSTAGVESPQGMRRQASRLTHLVWPVQLGSDHDAARVAVGVAADPQHVAVEGEPVRIVRDVRAEYQLRTVHGRRWRGVLRQARGGSDALAVQPREDLALDVEVRG
ncbi:hypothetical protein [Streptomyces mirabilis]|uniref:hypothetical protein n=1 Tax=Streptomyces mirabilis TaxID=68239 RepID=UPI00369B4F59